MNLAELDLNSDQRALLHQKRRSRLLIAKAKAKNGEKVNFCPFGCQDGDLDEHGYCHHLVGFTNSSPADCKAGRGVLEPMKVGFRGTRVVQVKSKVVNGREVYEPEQVKKTDVLELISTSHRVYRNVDAEKQS